MSDNLPDKPRQSSGVSISRSGSFAKTQRLLKEVISRCTCVEDLEAMWHSIMKMAGSGNLTAAEIVMNRILGKPGVGAFASRVDDELTERIDREQLSAMTMEELKMARDLASKIHGQASVFLPGPSTHGDGVVIDSGNQSEGDDVNGS